jgi:hypothetical protein
MKVLLLLFFNNNIYLSPNIFVKRRKILQIKEIKKSINLIISKWINNNLSHGFYWIKKYIILVHLYVQDNGPRFLVRQVHSSRGQISSLNEWFSHDFQSILIFIKMISDLENKYNFVSFYLLSLTWLYTNRVGLELQTLNK